MTASEQSIEFAQVAAAAALDKIADDVVILDVSEQLVITDLFVIASASTERQVNAIVDGVEEALREAGQKPVRREGTREGRWALIDYVDIVVHVQHTDERHFYGLDRLWNDCPRIEVAATPAGTVVTNFATSEPALPEDNTRVDSAADESEDAAQ